MHINFIWKRCYQLFCYLNPWSTHCENYILKCDFDVRKWFTCVHIYVGIEVFLINPIFKDKATIIVICKLLSGSKVGAMEVPLNYVGVKVWEVHELEALVPFMGRCKLRWFIFCVFMDFPQSVLTNRKLPLLQLCFQLLFNYKPNWKLHI
jgi:hypothetical protein